MDGPPARAAAGARVPVGVAGALAVLIALAATLVGGGAGAETGEGHSGGGGRRGAPGAAAATAATATTAARLLPLHAFEDQLRRNADVAHGASGDRVTGPDPYLLRALVGGTRFVGLLRGSAEILLLDAQLRVLDRAPAPRSPTGMAVEKDADDDADGDAGDKLGSEVFVCGALASEIARYRVTSSSIRRAGSIALERGHGARDLAAGPGRLLYAVDQAAGRLLTLQLGSPAGPQPIVIAREERPIGHGPIRVARVGGALIIDLLLDHALLVFAADDRGRPTGAPARIAHDGPIWSFDAAVVAADSRGAPATLIVVAGGVEDHALDRTIGSFGYIDSFLTEYAIPLGAPALRATRLGAINLSERGLVTPKVIQLQLAATGGGGRALVTGYGSSLLATIDWTRFDREPTVVTRALAPGTTSVARRSDGALVFADPLLDAWLVSTTAGQTTVPVVAVAVATAAAGTSADDRSSPTASTARLGEALFFTTLMAPWNRADGPASRFTCETCHFEAGVDGRTHHTGRGDVHATTKPLRGLLNNRPYFSRALDPDLATMVNNEFRVAGANSGRDPWFDLHAADFPWLGALGVTDRDLSALSLRRALIAFLAGLSHLRNPLAAGATGFNPDQRAGAVLFRDRCEGCHQARLWSDDATSRVPFEAWEHLIFSESAPVVWGSSDYQKTGVVPYVHERGARVPSLRRVSSKFPYFTNGSAKDLGQVIARARFTAEGFRHDGGADDDRLDAASAARLAAFLDLL